jgi:hypothetical protein
MYLAVIGCRFDGLYSVVTVCDHRTVNYTRVRRVQSPEEDPVSCFGSAPVSWPVEWCHL